MAATPTLSAEQVIETFECATEENQIDALREQQVVRLPAEGELFVAGDIHDNRRNFEKLLKVADIKNHPDRHIVLQELIHGDHFDPGGAEGSWEILYRAAELKCDFTSQVHFLMANHDLAQIHGEGIMKGGIGVCEAFNAGVKRDFKDRGGGVQVAITEFLLSLPLAIRTPNGLFLCHSVPADDVLDKFDYTAFDRPLTGPDYQRKTGAVYQLVWGRKTSPAGLDAFAERVGAKLLITGHQTQESGYATVGDKQLIIASEHNQGVFVRASLAKDYDLNALEGCVRKFVAVDLDDASADGDDDLM
jgi:hypothetical protein